MPVIGVIPTIPGHAKSGHAGRSAIVTLYDPDSVPAEQYRILGMKVHQACLQQNARILMVTSSAGGEGKSMTAINMATALAGLAEGSVLLVDADMRRPRLHEYLDTPLSSESGFHDLLLRPDDDISKYILDFENLHVILGSAPTANPIAVLASPKIRTLFDRLKQKFQFIVVDAPPTLPIADSHILSGLCDKVLFVVRSRKTPRELFQHAVESFDAANLIGAVLNDVEYQRSSYGYAYRYYRQNYLARK
jgi:capsular exopolysaccharide synthesis family protein